MNSEIILIDGFEFKNINIFNSFPFNEVQSLRMIYANRPYMRCALDYLIKNNELKDKEVESLLKDGDILVYPNHDKYIGFILANMSLKLLKFYFNDYYKLEKCGSLVREIFYHPFLQNKITFFSKNNKLHNEDGPAVISTNIFNLNDDDIETIRTECYLNGICHREDGPAIIHFHKGKVWEELYYYNNKLLGEIKNKKQYKEYVEKRKLLEYFQ